MKKLPLTLISILCIVSLLVFPQVIYADDADNSAGDSMKWLKEDEKEWVTAARNQLGLAKTNLEELRKSLTIPLMSSDLTPADHTKQSRTDAVKVNIRCGVLNRMAFLAPDSFQPVAGVIDGISGEADKLGDLANAMRYTHSKLDKPTKIPWVVAYPGLIISTVTLHTQVNRINNQLNKIEAAIESRIEELASSRKTASELDENILGGFFIATAAYGTPTAKEIDVLRRFRDEYLRKSSLGNEFIRYYYEKNPPVATFIAEHEVLRVIVREGFVEPVVKIVELTENWWVEE
ncbi:CFI-box-CTERM domain-containing protein [Chloroflexota bacterium]